jgi:predicted enzyme related to lactoylglutathione lyase
MPDATILGRFVWHELMTTDTNAAAAFFPKVMGWKTQPWSEDQSYTMFLVGRRPVAGLMKLPADGPQLPNWLTYVGTPDVDDTARQATVLGATVLKPAADIPTIGRFAILQDPQGAVFAAFTPLQDTSSDDPAGIGEFSWHELATSDSAAAFTFYQRLFGWEETGSMDMGPEMGLYRMFGRKGRPLGGIFKKPTPASGPPSWLAYVRVPDAKKTAAIITKSSGQIANGPMEVPGGDWIAAAIDPQGALFAVHSLKPATPAKAKTRARSAAIKKSPRKAKTVAKKGKSAARKSKPAEKKAKPAKTRARAKQTKSRKTAGKKKRR